MRCQVSSMIVKKHIDNGRLILAVCDEDIVGKKYEEHELVLDLSAKFYAGEKMSKTELANLIKKAYIINAVGQNSIMFLINKNIITKEECKKINAIPYANVIFLEE